MSKKISKLIIKINKEYDKKSYKSWMSGDGEVYCANRYFVIVCNKEVSKKIEDSAIFIKEGNSKAYLESMIVSQMESCTEKIVINENFDVEYENHNSTKFSKDVIISRHILFYVQSILGEFQRASIRRDLSDKCSAVRIVGKNGCALIAPMRNH